MSYNYIEMTSRVNGSWSSFNLLYTARIPVHGAKGSQQTVKLHYKTDDASPKRKKVGWS